MYFDSLIYIIKNIKGNPRSVTHAHARPVNFLGYVKIITEFVYEKLPNYKQKGFFLYYGFDFIFYVTSPGKCKAGRRRPPSLPPCLGDSNPPSNNTIEFLINI